MSRIDEIAEVAESVQGWLLPEAGPRLYVLARQAPLATAIEIGSWRGKSAIWIGAGLADREGGGTLYCIDTWCGTPDEPVHAEIMATLGPDGLFREFVENVKRAQLEHVVVPIRSTSVEAARSSEVPAQAGLVFIDAGHTEDDVLRDYTMWAPRVVPGGYLVMDDVPGWPGPTKIARETAACAFTCVEETHNQWVGAK